MKRKELRQILRYVDTVDTYGVRFVVNAHT